MTARDRPREHRFLERAGHAHGPVGKCWGMVVRGRLEAGQAAYGDRWRTLGLPRLLEELAEEAADLGAWAALAVQALDADDRGQAEDTLEAVARAGADAYAALAPLRRALRERG